MYFLLGKWIILLGDRLNDSNPEREKDFPNKKPAKFGGK
jgi:hypothetical protein